MSERTAGQKVALQHRRIPAIHQQQIRQQAQSNDQQVHPHQHQWPAGISTGGRIGDKLRAARITQGLLLAEIARKTRISRTNLIAMEESRYADLPATPFCRGFYRMYARMVHLDPDNTACLFESERARSPERKNTFTLDFGSMHEDVEAMAERPSLLIFTSIGMIIFILLAFFAFLCWFFSWNPASFLSQKLRSFDENGTLHNRDLRPATSSQENEIYQPLHRAVSRAIDEVKELRNRQKSVA
ncbi:helix-turn-helix domain-containing protein [Desulforhopalus vacuolatus]|uniref:helix-turn-helix domain-containing protein n=1 Tax=Desulforhopalus vacuolatus TaxID=40414 RepID=UPI00196394CD|nr:helix-turn-helix domain-containing protein [Desulforhopalus vacuolatus]MBM9519925.1 helix-turn-helix domain-containing protein [Desulforhopalus vacuolatus]